MFKKSHIHNLLNAFMDSNKNILYCRNDNHKVHIDLISADFIQNNQQYRMTPFDLMGDKWYVEYKEDPEWYKNYKFPILCKVSNANDKKSYIRVVEKGYQVQNLDEPYEPLIKFRDTDNVVWDYAIPWDLNDD